MKNKKPHTVKVALAIAAGMFLVTPAHAAGIDDLKKLPKKLELPAARQPANINEQTASATPLASAACAQSVAAKKLTLIEQGATLALREGVDRAMNRLNIADAKIPAKVENICQASSGLVFVERYTARWNTTVIEAITLAKAALELSGEAASYAAFRNKPDFSTVDGKQISRLEDDIKSDMSAIEAAITSKKVANQEKLDEANEHLGRAKWQAGVIAGWDKNLGEFIGDNRDWAFSKANLSNMRMFLSHVKLLGSTAESAGKVREAHASSERPEQTAAYKKKAEATRKQREKEDAEYEKKLLAELQL